MGDLTKEPVRKPKGFKRSKKEWEASAAEHLGKFLDKITATEITKIAAIGAGTYGIKQIIDNPYVALVSPMALILRTVNEKDRWIFSFFTSYMIVEHGIDIIKVLPI